MMAKRGMSEGTRGRYAHRNLVTSSIREDLSLHRKLKISSPQNLKLPFAHGTYSPKKCPFATDVIDEARRRRIWDDEMAVHVSPKEAGPLLKLPPLTAQVQALEPLLPHPEPPLLAAAPQRRPTPPHLGRTDLSESGEDSSSMSPSSSSGSLEWPSNNRPVEDFFKETFKHSRSDSIDSQASTVASSPQPQRSPALPRVPLQPTTPSERPRPGFRRRIATSTKKVTDLQAVLSAGGSASAPSAVDAGLQVAFEAETEIVGLGLEGAKGKVVITKDPNFEDLVVEVFRTTASSGLSKVAIRALTRKELADIYEWGATGVPPARYAWLCGLVEIRWSQDSGGAHVHLRGYDSRLQQFESLRADVRGMLDMQRHNSDTLSSTWAEMDLQSPQSDLSAVVAASCRLGIYEETADALHDCFVHADISGDGLINEHEFRRLLIHLGRGGQVCVDEARIHRYWCEVHEPHQTTIGFTRFAEWLVAKFPHIPDMTAWQIRRFAGICR